MSRKICLILCLSFLLPLLGRAQVFIEFTQSPSAIFSFTDLWNVSINNIGQSPVQAYLELQLTEQKEGEIFFARTQNLVQNQGMSLYSFENFRLASLKYGPGTLANVFKSTGQLNEGSYALCITLKNPYDDYTFSQKCLSFSITKESLQNSGTGVTKQGNKNFKFSGFAELTGYYTNRQANFTTMPGSYVQMVLNPNLTIYDVPIGGRFTLSTLQGKTMQNMNTYEIHFDGDQFKNILKKKLLELITKNNKLKDMNLSSLSGSMKQLNDLETTLKNPNVVRELGQIRQLDSLRTVYEQVKNANPDVLKDIAIDSLEQSGVVDKMNNLKDTSAEKLDTALKLKDKMQDSLMTLKDKAETYYQYKDSVEQQLRGLEQKIKALQWLDQKKAGYDKLLERKEVLTQMGQKFGVIDSSGKMKDVNSLKETIDYNQLNDPSALYSKLKNNKLLRKVDKILYGFKSFSLGMSSPNFSELTLRNMPLNGVLVEYEHKYFYTGFAYGDLQSAVPTYNLNHATYKRTAVAGSFGYGQKEKTHLHFNIFHAWDDSSSVQPRDSIFLYQKTPQRNYVISADFKVLLFKNKLRITGEVAGSQTTRDFTYLDSSIINPVVTNNPDQWITNIITQRPVSTNTSVDFAFNGKVEGVLWKGKTVLSGSVKRVGANFNAFGTPFLMRDLFSVELKATQRLWKNRITLMAFGRRNHDNLDGTKPLQSVFYTYGFDVGINIPKLPYFRASLMPVNLQNDSADFNMTILNVSSGYNYTIARRIVGATTLNYTYQDCVSSDSGFASSGHFITMNQLFTFKNSITLNFTSSYFNTANDSITRHVVNLGIGSGVTLFKKLNTSFGGNVYMGNTEFKWGAYLQLGVSFLKVFSFSIRAETNQYNNFLLQAYNPDYLQFVGKAVLIARW